jgi:hypothetical protein
MERCCCCHTNPIRINRFVHGFAFVRLGYLSFVGFQNLLRFKEILTHYCAHNLQLPTRCTVENSCTRRLHGRRTILNIFMHLNYSASYFNSHLIRTLLCYLHHSPHSLLLALPFTSSICYMFFSFTRFQLYIMYF